MLIDILNHSRPVFGRKIALRQLSRLYGGRVVLMIEGEVQRLARIVSILFVNPNLMDGNARLIRYAGDGDGQRRGGGIGGRVAVAVRIRHRFRQGIALVERLNRRVGSVEDIRIRSIVFGGKRSIAGRSSPSNRTAVVVVRFEIGAQRIVRQHIARNRRRAVFRNSRRVIGCCRLIVYNIQNDVESLGIAILINRLEGARFNKRFFISIDLRMAKVRDELRKVDDPRIVTVKTIFALGKSNGFIDAQTIRDIYIHLMESISIIGCVMIVACNSSGLDIRQGSGRYGNLQYNAGGIVVGVGD